MDSATMHLPDGVLSNPIAGAAWALCAGGVTVGLRRLDYERVPRVGVLGAVFFVSTLIAIPFPPASVHLLLNGLMGILLGWAALPAILLALALQAVQFGHGGLSSLGANTLVMGVPALLCSALFSRRLQSLPDGCSAKASLYGFLGGALGVSLACLLQALLLCATDRGYLAAAIGLFGAHIPVMLLDGLITAWIIGFLHRVQPEMLVLPLSASQTETDP